jgi:hypothetical protein
MIVAGDALVFRASPLGGRCLESISKLSCPATARQRNVGLRGTSGRAAVFGI